MTVQVAEEMVQAGVFQDPGKAEPICVHTSIKAYFNRSVNNECLNHFKL